jgi:hypothetical protein
MSTVIFNGVIAHETWLQLSYTQSYRTATHSLSHILYFKHKCSSQMQVTTQYKVNFLNCKRPTLTCSLCLSLLLTTSLLLKVERALWGLTIITGQWSKWKLIIMWGDAVTLVTYLPDNGYLALTVRSTTQSAVLLSGVYIIEREAFKIPLRLNPFTLPNVLPRISFLLRALTKTNRKAFILIRFQERPSYLIDTHLVPWEERGFLLNRSVQHSWCLFFAVSIRNCEDPITGLAWLLEGVTSTLVLST